VIGIGSSNPVQDPAPNRSTDLANSPQPDLAAGHEAHFNPLIDTRVSDREPEPAAQPRTHAHVNRRTHDDRQTATSTASPIAWFWPRATCSATDGPIPASSSFAARASTSPPNISATKDSPAPGVCQICASSCQT
jgi:hypothetical protein